MAKKNNPIHQLVRDAIEKGSALEAKDIRSLREQRKKSITLLKSVFWVGIVIFNLALWVPLPIEVSKPVLYGVAFAALAIAVIAPMLGLKQHHIDLELLKVNKQIPKKKTASEAGRVYIDQVKKQERPFVNVEVEMLEGSKWAAKKE